MTVYFLRHANAGKKRADSRRDEKRPLDPEGVEQCRRVGRVLAALDIGVEAVISSPLKRASQSAALVANEIGYEGRIDLDAALRPDADYAAFRELLRHYHRHEAILVVGHNPSLSQFLSRLVAGGAGRATVPLKKGGVARVETAGSGGTLDWLLTPRLAAALPAAQATVSEKPKMRRK